MDETWGHYAEWNKPVKEKWIVYDFTYIRYLKYSNSQEQKTHWWWPGTVRKGKKGSCLINTVFQIYKMKNFWRPVLHHCEHTIHD